MTMRPAIEIILEKNVRIKELEDQLAGVVEQVKERCAKVCDEHARERGAINLEISLERRTEDYAAEYALQNVASAIRALDLPEAPTQAGVQKGEAVVPNGLVAALRYQRQIDEDGIEVGVSRQAVDEAADILSKFHL